MLWRYPNPASSTSPAGHAWGTPELAAPPLLIPPLTHTPRLLQAEVDGRHQRVLRVSLTPEQVAQIFAEQPAVLRAYREHVPHRMAEEDFWRRYVRHEMHKEVGGGGGRRLGGRVGHSSSTIIGMARSGKGGRGKGTCCKLGGRGYCLGWALGGA